MNDTTQTLLRSLLKIGAGAAVSKGLADQSTSEVIIAGLLALAGVIWGVLHRVKPASGTNGPIHPMLFCLAIACFCSGCNLLPKLAPGADPIVVRAEQTEAIGKTTLDTFERIDNANRDFFRTNAPAMHAFAEYLRQPVVVNGTNLLPRGLAFIISLDSTKLAYKQGRASSNVLATAIAVLETGVAQAQSYISQQQPITK